MRTEILQEAEDELNEAIARADASPGEQFGDQERVGGRTLRRKGLPRQKGSGNLPR